MSIIHPTAIVSKDAELGQDVFIGPYCCVGDGVRLGDHVRLESHVVVDGRTQIGAHGKVFPFAAVGLPPQDMKYAGEPSELIIGSHCTIREHVTVQTGTEGGGMVTRVGDHCLLMVGAHVAHDCQIGDHVILVNNATLGGHVEIDTNAIIGGLAAVHQFVRIGKHVMIGGMSAIVSDIVPYCMATGNRAFLEGLNLVGLRRRGFPRAQIQGLQTAYSLLFVQEKTMEERIADVAALGDDNPLTADILSFVNAASSRSYCQPKARRDD